MRTILTAIAMAGLIAPPVTALAQDAEANETERYSVETTLVGKLIDDPEAAAVLQKMIPTIWENSMFQTAGRDLTLKAIQQYEPVLTDAKLAEIQAELDKIQAKK